ncbi:MAG: hypothetical protein CVT64_11625 [Actinobacteria bacterium HGW-Actinobacteria-4]|nr:MAG: hypothetical protein CVT64_11625 [Actinobacteria bacterium HGW-Actinobacteria-4]
MQGPLTIALTLSVIVFVLAAIADGRGLRAVRWVVRFADEQSSARSASRNEASPPQEASVARPKPTGTRPSPPPGVSANLDKHAAVHAGSDTRKRELSRQ